MADAGPFDAADTADELLAQLAAAASACWAIPDGAGPGDGARFDGARFDELVSAAIARHAELVELLDP